MCVTYRGIGSQLAVELLDLLQHAVKRTAVKHKGGGLRGRQTDTHTHTDTATHKHDTVQQNLSRSSCYPSTKHLGQRMQ